MRFPTVLALLCVVSCGDSDGDSTPGATEWEISYSGDLGGTIEGPICTVTGDNDIITIGCINRESPEAFNASATVPIFTSGQDSTTSATMTLSDGTPCSASDGASTDLNVTTATADLYVIQIAGNVNCNGQVVSLDGTIKTDGVVDLE